MFAPPTSTPKQALRDLARPLTVYGRSASASFANRVFLAPMSGVSDLPFRRIAARAGAGLVLSEMVASRELTEGSLESRKRMGGDGLGLHAVQLAGRDAHWMGEAARIVAASGAHLIDINMGCPAKKVTGGASGSALMRDLDHALTLVEATVRGVEVPVTVKMRLGWDDQTINAPELAKRAVDAGAAMITVHGRTRCQFYTGTADWNAVRAVVNAVDVPVVVNGDIDTPADAIEALAASGAAAIMIGRASYGRPWWPGHLAAFAATGVWPVIDAASVATEHYEALLGHFGTEVGLRCARKHVGWYLRRSAVPESTVLEALRSNNPRRVLTILRNERESLAA